MKKQLRQAQEHSKPKSSVPHVLIFNQGPNNIQVDRKNPQLRPQKSQIWQFPKFHTEQKAQSSQFEAWRAKRFSPLATREKSNQSVENQKLGFSIPVLLRNTKNSCRQSTIRRFMVLKSSKRNMNLFAVHTLRHNEQTENKHRNHRVFNSVDERRPSDLRR